PFGPPPQPPPPKAGARPGPLPRHAAAALRPPIAPLGPRLPPLDGLAAALDWLLGLWQPQLVCGRRDGAAAADRRRLLAPAARESSPAGAIGVAPDLPGPVLTPSLFSALRRSCCASYTPPAPFTSRKNLRIASFTWSGCVRFDACEPPLMTTNCAAGRPAASVSARSIGMAMSSSPWMTSTGTAISRSREVMS